MKPTLSDYRLRPHHSNSSINLYITCPLAYRFRYVDKIKTSTVASALVFGTAFHAACGSCAQCHMEGGEVDADHAVGIFEIALNTEMDGEKKVEFKKDESRAEMVTTGERMVRAFVGSWRPNKILGVGVPFCVNISKGDDTLELPLVGEYDLVEEGKDGKPVIVDWKTAARRWADYKCHKDLQATCYAYAFNEVNGVIPTVRFDVATKTRSPEIIPFPTSRAEDDFARLFKIVKMVERGVAAGVFVPNMNGFHCDGCEYAANCEAWHREAA